MRSVPRARRAGVLVVMAVLLVGALLGGCARVRTALAVQPDDTVTGEIVVATPARSPTDTGPAISVPTDLTSAVSVSRYNQDGYAGSLLRFSGLPFDQVGELTKGLAPTARPEQFQIRRAGGRVLVSGAADLTTVPVDKADVQLKISFPGSVVDTNGEVDGSTVSWTFTPGQVGHIAATVAYADPYAPSAVNWALGLAAAVVVASAGVVLLARRARNRPPAQRVGLSGR